MFVAFSNRFSVSLSEELYVFLVASIKKIGLLGKNGGGKKTKKKKIMLFVIVCLILFDSQTPTPIAVSHIFSTCFYYAQL